MARATLPRITWGVGFANTLNIGYPLDDAVSYSDPREGSQWYKGVSGIEDSWIYGIDYYLEGNVTWIPTANTTDPIATGWDGTTGFRAFLEWAREKNAFRFYPSTNNPAYQECYLTEPMKGAPSLEEDGSRRIKLKITSTTPFDGY